MNMDFNDEIVSGYDENIARVVPGYQVMSSAAVATCQNSLPDYAKILIIGAGTGHELEQLCLANPTWRFTAIEPAQAMLNQAQIRCRAYMDRIDWHHGTLDSFEQTKKYDACICLLVIHFLTDSEKRNLLMQIAHLTHGDLLLSQRLKIDNEAFLTHEIQHALLQGHPEDKREFLQNRLLALPAMSASNAQELYTECSFCQPVPLVQVFSYQLIQLKVKK